LDPRTKIAVGILSIVAVVAMQQTLSIVISFTVIMTSLLIFRMFREWISALKLILPVVVLVLLITVVSFDLETGMVTALRLMNLLTVSFIWFQGTGVEAFGDGLRKLRVPYPLAFILTTSMRYVPLISRRIRRIMDAQRSRGIDMRLRFRNISNFTALLMPLLVQSFLLSEELAMAMEIRGFSRKGRTLRKAYRLKPWEYVLMIAMLSAVVYFTGWEKW
jgi:energy-coupling factor transport system permease protein